jgi:hypothetical protein
MVLGIDSHDGSDHGSSFGDGENCSENQKFRNKLRLQTG